MKEKHYRAYTEEFKLEALELLESSVKKYVQADEVVVVEEEEV